MKRDPTRIIVAFGILAAGITGWKAGEVWQEHHAPPTKVAANSPPNTPPALPPKPPEKEPCVTGKEAKGKAPKKSKSDKSSALPVTARSRSESPKAVSKATGNSGAGQKIPTSSQVMAKIIKDNSWTLQAPNSSQPITQDTSSSGTSTLPSTPPEPTNVPYQPPAPVAPAPIQETVVYIQGLYDGWPVMWESWVGWGPGWGAWISWDDYRGGHRDRRHYCKDGKEVGDVQGMGRIENPDAFFKSHGALNREGSPIGKVIINEGRVTARSALNAHGEEHDKRRSGNGTLEFRNGHYVMRVPDNGRERGTPERNFNGAGIVRGGAHTSGHGSR